MRRVCNGCVYRFLRECGRVISIVLRECGQHFREIFSIALENKSSLKYRNDPRFVALGAKLMTVDNARQIACNADSQITTRTRINGKGRSIHRETMDRVPCRGKIRLKSQFSRQSSQQRRAARREASRERTSRYC